MIIREATYTDSSGIKECVASTVYYHDVDPGAMGGRWIVACPDDAPDLVVGCVWLMVEPPNAYLDFLAVSPKYQNFLGVPLLGFTQKWLAEHGVRYMRAAIQSSNFRAIRLGLAFRAKLDAGYALLYWQGD